MGSIFKMGVTSVRMCSNDNLPGFDSGQLLECCHLLRPALESRAQPLLVPRPLGILQFLEMLCGSFLIDDPSSILYLGCFTAAAKNIGEIVDILKHY